MSDLLILAALWASILTLVVLLGWVAREDMRTYGPRDGFPQSRIDMDHPVLRQRTSAPHVRLVRRHYDWAEDES